MVKYYTDELDTTFMALADPTRRAILTRLALGDCSVSELAKPFKISLPAISKHLQILEKAGLMEREIHGRVHTCCLNAEPMKEASDWITSYKAFWEKQFDALDKYLQQTKKQKKGGESDGSH